MKKTIIAFAFAATVSMCAPSAHAELSEMAKRNEKTADAYAAMPLASQAAFATGMVVGMRTILDLEKTGMQPPETEDVFAMLNYCYVAGNCRHVTPGVIAIAAYQKPSDAHKTLKDLEKDITK